MGTVELLDPHEQNRILGFAINKFRGDLKLLEPGIRMMEERLQKPCIGVVPHLHDLALDEEDSLGLAAADNAVWERNDSPDRTLRIAIVALSVVLQLHRFGFASSEPSVSLNFARTTDQLRHADVLILPGCKQTIDDLLWLRDRGIDRIVIEQARAGLIVGICGGMQMLGESISDPLGIEHKGMIAGLALLPIRTLMQPRKVTHHTHGSVATALLFGQDIPPIRLSGYEIHVGENDLPRRAKPFAEITRGIMSSTQHNDGCIAADGRIFGSYLHGLFDQDSFRHTFINAARAFHRLTPAAHLIAWKEMREASLNRLATEVEQASTWRRFLPGRNAYIESQPLIQRFIPNPEPRNEARLPRARSISARLSGRRS